MFMKLSYPYMFRFLIYESLDHYSTVTERYLRTRLPPRNVAFAQHNTASGTFGCNLVPRYNSDTLLKIHVGTGLPALSDTAYSDCLLTVTVFVSKC